MVPPSTPKIELHVHLEGAVRPATLLEIANRNDFSLPLGGDGELDSIYRYRDFAHFLELWSLTTAAIQTEADFRQVVLAYAEEAAGFGAVYVEGIFTPVERTLGGASLDAVFTGFCDGADAAREAFGVEVRLTPDIPRNRGLDAAMETVRFALKYRERGVVGVGLGGPEVGYPPDVFAPAFARARDGGLGSVPHAGEADGAASVRAALEVIGAARIRHGIRAVQDPGLLRELAARRIVCDVCPISNLRTGVVSSPAAHPLPRLLEAGVLCSISTDDPAMFDSDLAREYAFAVELGHSSQSAYEAGVEGALCDEVTRARLRRLGEAHRWEEPGASA